jgi:predicted  nucleic acid-binding Zn-ribbon protein
MDIGQLKDDVRRGRITPDRLVELVVTLQRELQAANQELDAAKRRIEDLKRQLGSVRLSSSPWIKWEKRH